MTAFHDQDEAVNGPDGKPETGLVGILEKRQKKWVILPDFKPEKWLLIRNFYII